MMNCLWRLLFYPFAYFYGFGVWLKRSLYLRRVLKRTKVTVPVISIGNLTVGGTGKTPIVHYLVKYYQSQGFKVGVVSRGYKGNFEGIQKVDLHKELNFGDEPMMLAERFSRESIPVPIYVGKDKSEACAVLCEKESVNIIIVDDGFQHWKLERDKDIVLLDSTRSYGWLCGEGALLPVGRARETWQQLKRADIFFLTKIGWAKEKDLQRIRHKLSKFSKPVVEWSFFLKSLRSFGNEQRRSVSESSWNFVNKWAVASGLGNPNSFEESIKNDLGLSVDWHQIYPDHYDFKIEDILGLLRKVEESGVSGLIISEKEGIKWSRWRHELGDKSELIWIAELEITPYSSVDWKHVSSRYLSF